MAIENAYAKSLDSFRDAIIEGATERIARTLFKAGAYRACLHLGIRKDFGPREVIRTLEENLISDPAYQELHVFLTSNTQKVEAQAAAVSISDLLKHIAYRKEKAEGLLVANYGREMNQALSAFKRAERLKKQLEAWKANAKLQDKIQYSKIVDIHDDHGSE
jgi:hypothetical protein